MKTTTDLQNLSKSCVLVNLSIRSWIANKQDSGVAAEVAAAKGVEDVTMGRYWKSLLPKCEELTQVGKAISKARGFHYANTLSYMHDGPRIIPVDHFEAYQAEMNVIKTEFNLAVNALLAKFDELKDAAKQKMGALFNELDYPDKDYIRSRYGIEVGVLPMPASDNLLNLGFDVVAANDMKTRLESELANRFEKNAATMWDQLDKNLEGLLKTLGDSKRTPRNESLDASRRMAALLPKLNVLGDTRLDKVCERLAEVLDGVNYTMLNVDRVRRHEITDQLRVLHRSVCAAKAVPAPALASGSEEPEEPAAAVSRMVA